MSKKWWGHPAIVYLLLLIVVILASWIGSIMEVSRAASNNELTIRSVLGVSGIRWAVRSAASSLSYAPIGNALMLFIAYGAAKGSGLFRAFLRIRNLSPKETIAFYTSLVVLTVYILLIVLGVFAGSNLLLSVTGSLKGSPLYEGLAFLLMLAVCLPSLVYGLSTESFRTAADCADAFCGLLPQFCHFLVTMLVASQLLQTIEYTQIDALLGISERSMRVISFIVYWLPLPLLVIRFQKRGKEV